MAHGVNINRHLTGFRLHIIIPQKQKKNTYSDISHMTLGPRPSRAISPTDRHPIPANGAVKPFLPLQDRNPGSVSASMPGSADFRPNADRVPLHTSAARDSPLRASTRQRCEQPQPLNPCQDSLEQSPRDRHLRHLEDHLSSMAHDLRPDLDQFLPQRRQRPVRGPLCR